MGKGAIDQTPTESKTDVLSACDESFSVSEDGRPVPIAIGQRKVSGRFVACPFYGQHTWNEPAKKSGGK